MGKITVVNNVTLDGVMQAPARPDEDTRGGFAHGGYSHFPRISSFQRSAWECSHRRSTSCPSRYARYA
jgi:hypothetical protein